MSVSCFTQLGYWLLHMQALRPIRSVIEENLWNIV